MSKYNLQSSITAKKNTKIAIAVSKYNSDITSALLKSCTEELIKRGVLIKNIKVNEVPGAFELPFACNKLANKKNYHAVIALGTIIKGETPHFDFIASTISQGIMDVGLKYNIPVIFGVLTTNNLKQAKDRIKGGKRGDKGIEAALTALEMI